MKRVLAMLMVLAMLFSLVGCSLFSSNEQKNEQNEENVPKNPAQKLGEYIVQNGTMGTDGKYAITGEAEMLGVLSNVEIQWNQENSLLVFYAETNHTYLGAKFYSTVYFSYGAEQQRVENTIVTGYASSTVTYTGWIDTDTYSPESNTVLSFASNNEECNNRSQIETFTVCLVEGVEKVLSESGNGVTLYELGFTSWSSIS